MNITFNDLYYILIFFSITSILITYMMSKTYITAATAFWFGWLFLISGASYAIEQKWIPMISSVSIEYLLNLFTGAFLGFNLASILFPVKRNVQSYNILLEKTDFILNKLSNKFLIILFLLGSVFLLQRISQVGFNMDYLENVRSLYNQHNRQFIDKVATHIGVIVSFLIILMAVRDSKKGVNVKHLGLVVLAAAPLGLANGGRTFLLNYLILYMSSLLLIRGVYGNNRYLLSKKEWIKILIYLFSLLFVFSILGFFRGGYGKEFDMLFTILIWPVSTMGAMDTWISTALASKGTNGYFTFGWFSSFLNGIGFVDFSQEYLRIKQVFLSFFKTHNSAAFIPKSILPDLIFDFGRSGPFIGMFIISFILQFFTLRFVGRGIFLHVLGSLSILTAFNSIQTSVLTPPIVVTLVWALVFSILIRIKYK